MKEPDLKDFFVSDDDALIDMPWVVKSIRSAYWGDWLTEDMIRKAARNSMCFGLYHRFVSIPDPEQGIKTQTKITQVGFARVVTDGTCFSWVCDVIIQEHLRRKGLGKFLMANIIKHPDVVGTICNLATRDAQDFYAQLGFVKGERMRRLPDSKLP